MAKLRWFFEKLADLAFDVVAGIIIYLIVGGYISQPLAEIFPQLPTILVTSLVLAIVAGLVYRFFKSVRFHRFVERTSHDLIEFLHDWDKLNQAYVKALESHNPKDTKNFEDNRTMLLYNYPKVSSALRITKYSYIDRIRGISVQNYDIIGNFLANSPFIGKDVLRIRFKSQEFEEQWDKGRTVIVATLGLFDCYRNKSIHIFYQVLRLVPIIKSEKQDSE